jgi:dienelactone hydrolase
MTVRRALAGAVLLWTGASTAPAQPAGEIRGSATRHTPESAVAVVQDANLALPAAIAGGNAWFGKWRDRPAVTAAGPMVLFLHGSSGLKLAAIEDWQRWLASLGIASLAPDSFALPDRLTYSSPVDKAVLERIHALRASEVGLALAALQSFPGTDPQRIVLAGTSEGATTIARNADPAFAARMIFSWSCEDNYFVEAHRTQVIADQPVLSVISAVDPFFSPANRWLGNAAARGDCAAALAGARQATVVLVPGAPHTLLNLPYVRAVTRGFLEVALTRR